MLVGLGVFVLGLVVFVALGLLLSIAFEFNAELGYAVAIVVAGLIGIYFMGLGVAQSTGLL